MPNEIRRIGKFYIESKKVEILDSYAIFNDLEFVPMRVESHHYNGLTEFIGLSPKFRLSELGEPVPEYDLKYDNGELVIKEILNAK